MATLSLAGSARRAKWIHEVNAGAPAHGAITHERTVPFGKALTVEYFRLNNGLRLLLCEDHSAPVVAYHTWYRVGSRHERTGKTGLAHLFEHLRFNETEHLKPGVLDRKLKEPAAQSNASPGLDWTNYNITIPREKLPVAVAIEPERMQNLGLRDPQV